MNLSVTNHPEQRVAVVEWTALIGAITAEALALREGCSVGSARARLLAAQRAGLLSRTRPLADQPALFSATPVGLRAAGLAGVAPGRVSAANARHSVVCAHVAAALERLYSDHFVAGERELRRWESAQAASLASAWLGERADGAALLHRPDMVLWPKAALQALPVAVEVELTVKAPRRLIAICRAWARCRCVAGVLYVVAPEVQAPLARALAAAGASEAIAAVALERLSDLGPLASPPNERTVTERA